MKILLISWYFPPVNDVAALRTGAIADYLQKHGHEVFVLTAAREGDASLACPLPPEKVLRTSWFDIDRLQLHSTGMEAKRPRGAVAVSIPARRKAALARLRAIATDWYVNMTHIPDRQIGWLPFAIAAGRGVVQRSGIELIYASGPSFTSFLVARSLAKQFRVPWIAEYRDGWSDEIYRPRAKWRQGIDRWLEERTIRSASGIVAVSAPWADYFVKRFGKPTIAIYNGFDFEHAAMSEVEITPDHPVSIVYLGELYGGLRNPSVLYEAFRISGLGPSDVNVVYYGPADKHVRPLADKMGVSDQVSVRPRVTHAESLKIQSASDVLLLLQAPDDPRNVPAKVFEYFASGRPILGIGLDVGVPAKLVRERNAGFYDSDPQAIARQLVKWVEEKRQTGRIAAIPAAARAGLSRSEQLAELDKFLTEMIALSHKDQ